MFKDECSVSKWITSDSQSETGNGIKFWIVTEADGNEWMTVAGKNQGKRIHAPPRA